jgi:hypothetical protein
VILSNAAACTIAASTTVNSINFTGYTGTFTHNASVTLTIDGQDGSGNSLIMGAGMTYTLGSVDSSIIAFTGAGTNKITTNGIPLGSLTFNNSGDTFQLQDNLIVSGSTLYLQAGTFDPNSKTVTFTSESSTIRNNFTFYKLVKTGTASKTNVIYLRDGNSVTITNELSINGNSGIISFVYVWLTVYPHPHRSHSIKLF